MLHAYREERFRASVKTCCEHEAMDVEKSDSRVSSALLNALIDECLHDTVDIDAKPGTVVTEEHAQLVFTWIDRVEKHAPVFVHDYKLHTLTLRCYFNVSPMLGVSLFGWLAVHDAPFGRGGQRRRLRKVVRSTSAFIHIVY